MSERLLNLSQRICDNMYLRSPAPFTRAVRGRFFLRTPMDECRKYLLLLGFPLKKGGQRGLFFVSLESSYHELPARRRLKTYPSQLYKGEYCFLPLQGGSVVFSRLYGEVSSIRSAALIVNHAQKSKENARFSYL